MNFIELRDTNDNLKLLNINHIISVEPHSIKIGEKDRCYKSVSKVGELIKSVNGAY